MVAQVPATCEGTGKKAHYYCSACETYFTADTKEEILEENLVIPAKGHNYGTLVALVPATCEEEGLEAHYQCSVCEKYFDAEKNNAEYEALVISKLGHNYDAPQYIWNDEHTKCTATKVCKNDSKHVVTETVDATYEVTKEATAEEDGLGVYTTEEFVDPDFEVQTHEEEIPATGHNYGTPTYEWNEDYSQCVATVACTDDGCDKEITETSTATVVPVAATCTESGKITYNAVFKNALFKAQTYEKVLDALGHANGEVKYVWNAELTECSATLYCANDIKHIIDEEIVSVSVDTDEPTCVDEGLITYTATFTKAPFETQTKEKSIDALGHTPGTATYEWTSEFACIGTVECTVCHNDILVENANVTEKTTNATCEADGKTIYTAAFTNSSFETQTKEVVLDKTGHADGEVVYTWNEDNSKCTAVLKCANDASHELATETIDSTNVVTPSTCKEKGKTVYTATFENTKLGVATKEVEIPLLPHTNAAPTYEWVTEYSEYAGEIVCSECGHQIATATATISSVTTDPTCEDAGQTVYTLEFTNSLFETQTETVVIPKLGHKDGEITYTWNEGNVSCTAELHCEHDNTHILDSQTVNATVDTTPAECEEDGSKVYTATFTKEGFEEQVKTIVLDKLGHTYGTPSYTWAEDNSSCTGVIECTVCHKEVVKEIVDSTSSTTATCTEAGQTTYSVDFADNSLVDQTKTVNTDAFGHTYIVEEDLNSAVAPSCTTAGNIAYYHCERCDKYFNENEEVVDSVVVDALGHNIVVSNENTICDRENCGLSYTNYYLRGSMSDNNWKSQPNYRFVVDHTTNTATLLLELYEGDEFKLTLYSGWDTSYGYSSTLANFNKDKFTNTDDDNFKCNVKNYYIITITYSGSKLSSFEIKTTTHDHTMPENPQYTINDTHHYYACTTCANGKFDYEEHIYSNDCDAICNTCSYEREVEGHDFGSLVEKVPSTCTTDGHEAYYYCSICETYFDATKVETTLEALTIYATDHDFNVDWTINADNHYKLCANGCGTKDSEGLHVSNGLDGSDEKCEICNAALHEHEFNCEVENITYVVLGYEPTCQSVGTYHRSCSCGTADSDPDNVFTGTLYGSHTYVEKTIVLATCTTEGKESHYVCSVEGCNLYFNSEKEEISSDELIIPSLGHELVTENATSKCSRCSISTKNFYVVGSMNGWDNTNTDYRLIVDTNTYNSASLDILLIKDAEFKILYYGSWDLQFGIKNGVIGWGDGTGRNNITVDDPGLYTIVISNTQGNSPTCTITLKEAHTDSGCVYDNDCDMTCNVCLEEREEQKHGELVNEVPATCTETGVVSHYYCEKCEKYYMLIDQVFTEVVEDDLVINALGHTEVIDSAVDATCIATGLTEGKHCSVCEEVLIAQETVNALGHNYIATIVNPTCEKAGYTSHDCSRCEASYTDTPTEAKGHTEANLLAKNPTCTETGLTAGKYCSVCEKELVAQETVDALGHTEVIDSAVEATCIATGLTEGKHCSVCNHVILAQEVVEIDEDNHNLTGDYYQSTDPEHEGHYQKCSRCGNNGAIVAHTPGPEATETTAQKCTACDKVLVEALGCQHTALTHIEAKEATCTATGNIEYYSCSCGKNFADEEATTPVADVIIAKKAHTPEVLPAKEATCTQTGLTEGSKCSVCEEVLVDQSTVPMIAHTPEVVQSVAATCTETGLTEGSKCSVCDYIITAQEEIAALGHNLGDVAAKAATCTEVGWNEYQECSRCHINTKEEIAALGCYFSSNLLFISYKNSYL